MKYFILLCLFFFSLAQGQISLPAHEEVREIDVRFLKAARCAIKYGDTRCSILELTSMTELLNEGADVNFRGTSYGYTALQYALELCDAPTIKFLLDHGANPDIQEQIEGFTPLHVLYNSRSCAFNGSLNEIAMYLLEAGADLNVKDNSGRSVFDFLMGTDRWFSRRRVNGSMAPVFSHYKAKSDVRKRKAKQE